MSEYHYAHGQPGELFDLEHDPQQCRNVIEYPAYATIREKFDERLREHWDVEQITIDVRKAQQRRRFIAETRLKTGQKWDYAVPEQGPRVQEVKPFIGCGKPVL